MVLSVDLLQLSRDNFQHVGGDIVGSVRMNRPDIDESSDLTTQSESLDTKTASRSAVGKERIARKSAAGKSKQAASKPNKVLGGDRSKKRAKVRAQITAPVETPTVVEAND